MHVALQVLSYEEPDLYSTLDAWAAQDPQPWVSEIDYHAAVTPRSEIRAGMVEQAESHPTFDLFQTPPGKLSSRNAAHDRAVDAGADVLVAVDADAPPVGGGVLSALLRPFQRDSRVVAVNSSPISARSPQGGFSAAGAAIDAAATVEDLFFPHLHGQGAAISRAGWLAAGPFDTSIDETAAKTVRAEEELHFYWRLRAAGRVARAGDATVYNDPRRHYCRLAPSLAPEGYCEKRGAETFAPRGRP